MIAVIGAGLGAAAAWTVGLLLIRFSPAAVAFHALVAGALCSVAEGVLRAAGHASLSLPVTLALFLLMTLAVSLESGKIYGNAVLAFCAAWGAEGVFRVTWGPLAEAAPVFGGAAAVGLPLSFALAAIAFRNNVPASDWREYFSGPIPETQRLAVRVWHIYGFLAVPCGLGLLCPPLAAGASAGAALALLAALAVLFWAAVLCASLMVEYRRETTAVLVEKQYREETRSFMNVIRSQRHDYNFHIQTLARLLRSGNLPACENYVNELVKDTAAMNALLPIQDPAVAAMISSFRTLAAREGIELHTDIQDDLSRVATTAYETNKIISNLLQNAIDETRTHQDKSYGIHLTILKRGEFCVIHVVNAFPETVSSGTYIKDIYRQGYTTKAGHDGVGLSSVKTLLERYRGVIYTQMEQGTIRFTAKIPVRYSARPEEERTETYEL